MQILSIHPLSQHELKKSYIIRYIELLCSRVLENILLPARYTNGTNHPIHWKKLEMQITTRVGDRISENLKILDKEVPFDRLACVTLEWVFCSTKKRMQKEWHYSYENITFASLSLLLCLDVPFPFSAESSCDLSSDLTSSSWVVGFPRTEMIASSCGSSLTPSSGCFLRLGFIGTKKEPKTPLFKTIAPFQRREVNLS